MDINNIKIFQWNCRSLTNKIGELRSIITEYDIIILSETWLNDTITVNIPDYQIVRKDREDGVHGGVTIIIRKDILFKIEPNVYHITKSLETIAISIPILSHSNNNSPPSKLLIISLYRTPDNHTSTQEWNSLFESSKDFKYIYIGGDFNAHHPLWGANKITSSGTTLVNSLLDFNLIISNDGSHTYFRQSYNDAISQDTDTNSTQNLTSSPIDLTIVSANIHSSTTWEIFPDNMGSDHFPIVSLISLKPEKIPIFSTHKINTKKTNWKTYHDILESIIVNHETAICSLSQEKKYSLTCQLMIMATKTYKDPNKLFPELVNLIETIKENPDIRQVHTTPEQKMKNIFKSRPATAPWWNDECSSLVLKRREAANNLLKNPNPENLKKLRQIENNTKKKLAQIRKQKFREYTEENLSNTSDIKTVWNTVHKFNKTKNTNIFANNDIELIEHSKKFIKEYTLPDSTTTIDYNRFNPQNLNNLNNELDEPFTIDELVQAIKVAKRESTPGLDQISNLMLKNAPEAMQKILLDVLNYFFSNNIFPNEWHEFLIILIPKQSKSKFRPIALASVILKIVERMINTRLTHYIEQNDLLPDAQNGFRKSKSCTLSLAKLLTKIHSAFINNEVICGILLDIKSAFDNVCPITLQKILDRINIPIKIKQFIYKLMTNRKLFFKVANKLYGPYIKNIGTPQGCVLSPILYSLYVIALSLVINYPITLLQYADDTLILYQDKDIQEAIRQLESALPKVDRYFYELKLSLSPEKTKFIIFTKSHFNTIENYKLLHNNNHISPSRTVKYLGLHIDHNLSWTDHYKHIINKSVKLLNILKVLRNTWWGGHPQVLLNIYKALIRSTFEYSLFLTKPKQSALLDKLQKIQNQGLRLALGYRNSTPINVIHAEAHTTTINIRNIKLCNTFILKELSNKNSTLIQDLETLNLSIITKGKLNLINSFLPLKSLNFLSEKTKNKIQTYLHPIPYDYNYKELTHRPKIDLSTGIKIQKSDNPQKKFTELFDKKFRISIPVFTDGSKSKNPEQTGLAIYFPLSGDIYSFQMDCSASIFTLEAQAIYIAIQTIHYKQIKDSIIFTDSRSTLEAIKNFSPAKCRNTPHLIPDIISLLSDCNTNDINVKLIWIPAHMNITHNEKVDALAKDAAKNGTSLQVKLHFSNFMEHINKHDKNLHKSYLLKEARYKGNFYFSNFFNTNSTKPWFHKTNLSRYHIVTTNRIRANHYSLAASLHRKSIIDSPECPCGHDNQDIDHIIWACPTHNAERAPLLKKINRLCSKLKIPTPTSTNQMLKNPNSPFSNIVIEFFKKCNLFI